MTDSTYIDSAETRAVVVSVGELLVGIVGGGGDEQIHAGLRCCCGRILALYLLPYHSVLHPELSAIERSVLPKTASANKWLCYEPTS
jgi:hypothetical protein